MREPAVAKARNTRGPAAAARLKPFDNEWILETFASHSSFFTKRMFGGLAAYLFDRLMLVLVEPTRTGRWQWHGVLICTSRERHAAIRSNFRHLRPHAVLGKWLYIDTTHPHFEATMAGVAAAVACDDERFGVQPQVRSSAARRRGARR
jgi:hypothetical protein